MRNSILLVLLLAFVYSSAERVRTTRVTVDKKGRYGIEYLVKYSQYEPPVYKVVVKPAYSAIADVMEPYNLYAVCDKNKWALLKVYSEDKALFITELVYDSISRLGEGWQSAEIIKLYTGGLCTWAWFDGLPDQNNFHVAAVKADEVRLKTNKYIETSINGKVGLYTKDGTALLPAIFEKGEISTLYKEPGKTFSQSTEVFLYRGKDTLYLRIGDEVIPADDASVSSYKVWWKYKGQEFTSNGFEKLTNDVTILERSGDVVVFRSASKNTLGLMRGSQVITEGKDYTSITPIKELDGVFAFTLPGEIKFYDLTQGFITTEQKVISYKSNKRQTFYLLQDSTWRRYGGDREVYTKLGKIGDLFLAYNAKNEVIYIPGKSGDKKRFSLPAGAILTQMDFYNYDKYVYRLGNEFGYKTPYKQLLPVFDQLQVSFDKEQPAFIIATYGGNKYLLHENDITTFGFYARTEASNKCSNPDCKNGIIGREAEVIDEGGEYRESSSLKITLTGTYVVTKIWYTEPKIVYHDIPCPDPIHTSKRMLFELSGDDYTVKETGQ